MQRIAGSPFINGNPATSTQGTVVTADWLNAVQEEIAGAIEGLGGVLNPADNGQLLTQLIARLAQYSAIPVGTISPWMGGYFSGASNSGFTDVLGNTVALANARLNPSNWYVCDGTALNMAGSPIFNGAGRYLPNLTDNRFIQGGLTCGGIGGSSTMAHTHTGPSHSHTTAAFTLGLTQMPNHDHYIYGTNVGEGAPDLRAQMTNVGGEVQVPCAAVGGGLSHAHGNTGAEGTGVTGAASNAENRPLFLSCLYIMKVA